MGTEVAGVVIIGAVASINGASGGAVAEVAGGIVPEGRGVASRGSRVAVARGLGPVVGAPGGSEVETLGTAAGRGMAVAAEGGWALPAGLSAILAQLWWCGVELQALGCLGLWRAAGWRRVAGGWEAPRWWRQ